MSDRLPTRPIQTCPKDIQTTPERYDGNYIFENYKDLRERRHDKLTPGRTCRYVIPAKVFEGRVISTNGPTVMVQLDEPNCVIQTTAEYVIPTS